jgi:hypothetical protein
MQVQSDVAASMEAFVSGSASKGRKGNRKATATQTEAQKITFSRERSTIKYRPRKAATHKDRT